MRCPLSKLRARPADEAGVSLVEVLVAMVLLGLLASAVLTTLLLTVATSRNNSSRVVAANLVSDRIENLRDSDVFGIADGRVAVDRTVGTTVFRVVTDAAFVPVDSATSTCDAGAGSRPAYKRITVTASWPSMGRIPPVRGDTLIALPITGMDNTKGSLAVPLKLASGNPTPAQVVTLLTSTNAFVASQTTGADGCALFTGLAPGTYTVTVNTPAFTSYPGGTALRTVTGNTVTAATVTKVAEVPYDQAGVLAYSYATPPGYPAPAALPLTLQLTSPGLYPTTQLKECGSPGATSSCVNGAGTVGSPRVTSSLFPFATPGYIAYAGDCADSAPSPLPASLNVGPGVTRATTVALGGADLRVQKDTTTWLAKPVYAVHLADATCTVQESYAVGTTTAASGTAPAALKVALPYGTWRIATTPDLRSPPAGGWPVVTVNAVAPVSATVVLP